MPRMWMVLKGMILVLAASALDTSAVSAQTSDSAASGGYFIEFRAASIGTYGHSYIAYGQLNAKGQPAATRYADLHPTGNYALMALGHVVPVPANTTWDPDVLKLPVTSSYRRRLNASEYQKLLAAIQKFRANKQPYWNAVTYNCNNFVADMAQAIGLKAPSTLLPSFAFIPALRDMNEATQKPAAGAPASGRKPSAAQARQSPPS